jgi:hypothetical protein
MRAVVWCLGLGLVACGRIAGLSDLEYDLPSGGQGVGGAPSDVVAGAGAESGAAGADVAESGGAGGAGAGGAGAGGAGAGGVEEGSAGAAGGNGPAVAYPFDGYWEQFPGGDPGDYDRYLKIQNDAGYYCVSDGKSSYRFEIVGTKFIAIGLSGPDTIEFMSPNTLRITGEEKGLTYTTDFYRVTASKYPQYCVNEEIEFYEG